MNIGNIYRVLAVTATIILFSPVALEGQEGYTFRRSFPEGPNFTEPTDVAIDKSGNIYVVDDDSHVVTKLAPGGCVLSCQEFYMDDQTLDERLEIWDIAVDMSGNICVAVSDMNHEKFLIRRYTPRWEPVTEWETAKGWWLRDIAIDNFGNVYVVEEHHLPDSYRVEKFTSDGNLLVRWGRKGSGQGEFHYSSAIALDNSGNVYIADSGNERVQKFDSDGNFLMKWGIEGQDDGEFRDVTDVAVDSLGNVYVADSFSHRIQKFDSDGNFLMKWGFEGIGEGQFDQIAGTAVDAFGEIYITDRGNQQVQKFTPNGIFLDSFGARLDSDGYFDGPTSLALDKNGDIYVGDAHNYRIQKTSPDGTFLTKWGRRGIGAGLFAGIGDVAVDNTGKVYVLGGRSIQKFTPEGKFLKKWEDEDEQRPSSEPSRMVLGNQGNIYVSTGFDIIVYSPEGDILDKWEIDRLVNGGWPGVTDISVDNGGNIYAIDNAGFLRKLDPLGVLLMEKKLLDSDLPPTYSMTLDDAGSIYILNQREGKISKFGSNGLLVTEWKKEGCNISEGNVHTQSDIAVDKSGTVYVTDTLNHRIQIFWPADGTVEPNHKYIGTWGLVRDGYANYYCPDAALGQNYPNPFNPETWIPYNLAIGSEVVITIYDIAGHLIRTMELGYIPAGSYQDKSRAAYWSGKNDHGEEVSSGLYFYTIKTNGYTSTKKMTVAR